MPYPVPIATRDPNHNRFASILKSMQSRLRKLEKRCASFDSGLPLNMLPGVVASASPLMVTVNGAASATGPYQYLSSYTPAVNDAVLLAPVNAMYAWIVLGKIV